MPTIFVTHKLGPVARQSLLDGLPVGWNAVFAAEQPDALHTAEVVFGWRDLAGLPDSAPALRWVHSPSAGVDHLHGAALWQSGVTLTNSPGVYDAMMAEHGLMLILALARRLPAAITGQSAGRWVADGLFHRPARAGADESAARLPVELDGQMLTIVGYGHIGRAIARRARAFGLTVIGVRRRPRPDEPMDAFADELVAVADLPTVLPRTDILLLVAPLTDQTRGLIGRAELRLLPPGAFVVNIGRGELIDQSALIEALTDGHLGGAGLDVTTPEPLPEGDPLWSAPNLILTPHVGGVSDQAHAKQVAFFLENLARYVADEPLLNRVDRSRGY